MRCGRTLSTLMWAVSCATALAGERSDSGGWLGVQLSPVPAAVAYHLKLADDAGVMVRNVVRISPADRAGLERFDVIVEADGEPVVDGVKGFSKYVRGREPEDELKLSILRRGERRKLAMTLGNDVNAVADFGDIPIVGDPIKLFTSYPENLEQLPKTALGDMRWNGSTALHGAATSNQKSIIQYLVDNGAKLDVRNKLGWTPLMVAEGGQFGATVKEFPEAAALIRKLMIDRGMNPDLYSKAGAKQAAVR